MTDDAETKEEVAAKADIEDTSAPTTGSDQDSSDSPPSRIYLVPYPKIIFFYPTYLVGLIAAIYMTVASPDLVAKTGVAFTSIFLGVLAVNMVVLAFDFPRATSLTMFFLLCAMMLGALLAFTQWPALLPQVSAFLSKIQPMANGTFFWVFSIILTIIYLIVFISVRFDYWEVRPNELLHHHGILSDLKRFSAPNLRIDKEINDVFEYLLLKSGRLILQPSNERRAIILDNVLFIGKKEEAITRMLGALQVQVRDQ